MTVPPPSPRSPLFMTWSEIALVVIAICFVLFLLGGYNWAW
jgi:hypothetical protein